jgi:hypothetical protein
MKNKLIFGAICAGLLGLAVYVVISGGKKLTNVNPNGPAMTVVVELPKTNAAGSAAK